jgi:Glycine zipper
MAQPKQRAIFSTVPGAAAIIPILARVRGRAMLNKKCFGAVLLAAAAVSGTAMAGDRGTNTAVGAVVGAAIGHSAGGRDGAIVGGVLGAAVGNSISTEDDYYRGGRGYASATYYSPAYVESRPVYVEQAPVYYEAPRPVYYEAPRPVYYESPRYYREPVVIVEHGHHGHWGHGGRWHGR